MFGLSKLLPRIVSAEWSEKPVKAVVFVDAPSAQILAAFIADVQREFQFHMIEPRVVSFKAKLTYEVVHQTETSAVLVTFGGHVDQVKMAGLKAAAARHVGVQFAIWCCPTRSTGRSPHWIRPASRTNGYTYTNPRVDPLRCQATGSVFLP